MIHPPPGLGMLLSFIVLLTTIPAIASAEPTPPGEKISAADPLFLASILDETWDTTHAVDKGFVDCMMPASDVDLNVVIKTPGVVTVKFDAKVYKREQAMEAGPRWILEVDGQPLPEIVIIGPAVSSISSPELQPGRHRVRFVQIGNTSGSMRWAADDPQLSRVTGASIPGDATLEQSQRAAQWFLPITDSIGEGYKNINTTRSREGAGAYTNNYFAWPSIMARMMSLSIGGYMISGIGVVRPGIGVKYGALNPDDPTRQSDGWDHIFEGVKRPFTTAPKFILLNVGSNEFATDGTVLGHSGEDPSSRDENVQKNLETFIAAVRSNAKLKRTPLLLGVAFGGFKRTPMQRAVAAYKAAHPDEQDLYVFDLAFGSPALTTTAGVDEIELFNGLTKNRPDDRDTIPSPQAPDRTHPYAIATPAIGSIDAHTLIAKVFTARLTKLLKDGAAPASGPLTAGEVRFTVDGATASVFAARATGGSPPYTYQFERSADAGKTWTPLGNPIDSQASTIKPLTIKDNDYHPSAHYRLEVTDSPGAAERSPTAAEPSR